MLVYDQKLKLFSRRLRREMTDAEQRLWYRLRRKQLQDVQFYRQKPLGNYVVDFYAPAVRLVVELDGGQHFEAMAMVADEYRSEVLRRMGLEVLRFDNRQVLLETDAVVEEIWRFIDVRIGRA
ncbi:MAG: endonuclease domain-containing protein [Pseudomonadota bacterium]